MRLLPPAHPARRAAAGLAAAMDAAALAATVAAVAALAWGAHLLLAEAGSYFEMAGGWRFLSYARTNAANPDGIRAMMPGLHIRAAWFGLAWLCLVFGTGCLCLAVAGARSLWWRLHGLLRGA